MTVIFLFSPSGLFGQHYFPFERVALDHLGNDSVPAWQQLPPGRWEVDTLNPLFGTGSLHHSFDSPESSRDLICFRHGPLDYSYPFELGFRIRHAFDPSSVNNWQLILGAEILDEGNGEEPVLVDGLVLGVNYTGSDDLLSLWQVLDGEKKLVGASSLNYQEGIGTSASPAFRFRGDGAGFMELWMIGPDILLGSFQSSSTPGGRLLLIQYEYSSARDRALWIDELVLNASFLQDSIGPEVLSVEVPDEHSVLLRLSETVLSPSESYFALIPGEDVKPIQPVSLELFEKELTLYFAEIIPNRIPASLSVQHLCDPEGNLIKDTTLILLRNEPFPGDVVVNELMFDPYPAISLSEEYLELYNRSEFEVDVRNWNLAVGEKTYSLVRYLPDSGGNMLPGSYLVLQGIPLPNDGSLLALYEEKGRLIHSLSYAIPWDGLDWKKEGGWSLELPDADQYCRSSELMEYSSDPSGGTPGRKNSSLRELDDKEEPVLLYLGNPEDPKSLILYFSEQVAPDNAGLPLKVRPGNLEHLHLSRHSPPGHAWEVSFEQDIQHMAAYTLTLASFEDCSRNPCPGTEKKGGPAKKPVEGAVLINELMFDPMENSPEFIELYLPGQDWYDLADFSIYTGDQDGYQSDPIAVSQHSRLAGPGAYLVLTSCIPHLREAYSLELTGGLVEVPNLASLKNNAGSIYLADRAGNRIDEVQYSLEMHSGILEDSRGVSLERISIDRPSWDSTNWHSASSSAGYATPGKGNSQQEQREHASGFLQISPEVFSPDNDGFEDLLNIVIEAESGDWMLRLWITDLEGNLVRELANMHISAPLSTYSWDGEDYNGRQTPMGFYIVHARAYCPLSGETKSMRKALGLIYR